VREEESVKKLLLAAVALAALVGTAKAQVVEAPPGGWTTSYKCVIANELCFILRVGAGGLSATQRIDQVNERLAYILGYERLTPGNTFIVEADGRVFIFVGRSLLVEVTPEDAQANGTTPLTLAEFWTANLQRALPQARPV
jgi:hypothetical protein